MQHLPDRCSGVDMNTKRSRTFFCGGIVIALAGLVLLTIAAVVVFGVFVDRTSPKTIDVTPAKETQAQTYSLNAGQQEVVNRLGPPQAFSILFYQQEADEQKSEDIRQETWTYYDQGKEVVFINGELVSEIDIEAIPGVVSPTPYRPEQFTAYETLEEITVILGGRSYLSVPLENELVPGGVIYYAGQLILGLKDDRLRSIQALALFKED
jgi:hypothetical protein